MAAPVSLVTQQRIEAEAAKLALLDRLAADRAVGVASQLATKDTLRANLVLEAKGILVKDKPASLYTFKNLASSINGRLPSSFRRRRRQGGPRSGAT
jgi:hypothetical protein